MKKNLLIVLTLAATAAALAGCNTTPTQDGAVVGGALGAGLGAIIGNQSHGRSGEGALIGAGVGALTGALVGDHVDDKRQGTRRVTTVENHSQPQRGHYETRIVEPPSGERYEEKVWIPDN